MSHVEERLKAMGLVLPPAMKPPNGIALPFRFVHVGAHARSAVGLAELPFDIPVEIEGEVEVESTPS